MNDFCSTPSGFEAALLGVSPDAERKALALGGCVVRTQIAMRDKLWSELKLVPIPSETATKMLRVANDACVRILAANPNKLLSALQHVEIMLWKVCEIHISIWERERLAQRRPGSASLDLNFLRRSFELAAADEELPPGQL